MQKVAARVLNAAGIAAPMLWLASVIFIGSLRPEYSHYRQYVSELAARGTSTQCVPPRSLLRPDSAVVQ